MPCISDFYIHYYIVTPTVYKTVSGDFNVYHEPLKLASEIQYGRLSVKDVRRDPLLAMLVYIKA